MEGDYSTDPIGSSYDFIYAKHFFLFGSIVPFGTYLTLIGIMGTDKASYAYAITVMPVVALIILSLQKAMPGPFRPWLAWLCSGWQYHYAGPETCLGIKPSRV